LRLPRLGAGLLAVLALAGCGASTGGFDFDTCGLRPRAVLPIDTVAAVPLVSAQINGAPARFILDTGAEEIVLTSPAVQRLHLASDAHRIVTTRGAGGESRRFPAIMHGLRLGGMDVPDHLVPVLPRPLPMVDGVRPDGLLGVTLLSAFEVDLDFPDRTMTLYAGRLCPATVVPTWPGRFSTLDAQSSVRGRFIVPIRIDGHAMSALIDTGTQTSVVATDAAAAAGVSPAMLARDPRTELRGAGPDLVATHMHVFADIALGDTVFHNVPLLVADRVAGNPDVILGMDYLAGHRIWLSYARRRVFIAAPAPGPAAPQG
jgi:predicted aspartyl protease